MDAQVFVVSSSPLGTGTVYAWRTHRTPSLLRSIAGIAGPAFIAWLLTLAGLTGTVALLIFIFAWMAAYLVPSGDYIEFDFLTACIVLPGRICVPFRDIRNIRFEFLPMDLLHDWTNVSVHFETADRNIRLDLLGQEMQPIEAFVRRICSVAHCTFTKDRMDLDRSPRVTEQEAHKLAVDCPQQGR